MSETPAPSVILAHCAICGHDCFMPFVEIGKFMAHKAMHQSEFQYWMSAAEKADCGPGTISAKAAGRNR